jgi:hypothetical protein
MATLNQTIHVGCKQLGIDEDGRRAIYLRVVGKPSQTEMTDPEKQAVVAELRRLGFQPASKPRPDGRPGKLPLDGKYLSKMRAMWIALYNLGMIDDPRDSAIEAFALERQVKSIDAIRFIYHADDGAKVIDGMKAMLTRAGVNWKTGPSVPPHRRTYGYRIAAAQWAKLGETGGLMQEAHAIAGRPRDFSRMLTDEEWIVVMNALGKRVRAMKGVA